MSKPKIAGTKPVIVDLEPGTYYWCACGLSENQPYCDGSHAGSGMQPVALKLTEKGRQALCMCKHTKDAPSCDGSHGSL